MRSNSRDFSLRLNLPLDSDHLDTYSNCEREYTKHHLKIYYDA